MPFKRYTHKGVKIEVRHRGGIYSYKASNGLYGCGQKSEKEAVEDAKGGIDKVQSKSPEGFLRWLRGE